MKANQFYATDGKYIRLEGVAEVLDTLEEVPTFDVNDPMIQNILAFRSESNETTCWIHSNVTTNRSSLFYTYRLDRLNARTEEFLERVAKQIKHMIPGEVVLSRFTMMKSPVMGIKPHIDSGVRRMTAINIGVENNDGYRIQFNADDNLENFYDSPLHTFELPDREAMMLNVKRAHVLDNVSNQSRQRIILSYSIPHPYEETLQLLNIPLEQV